MQPELQQPFATPNEYVLGFAFKAGRGDAPKCDVLLLIKQKPAWQAKLLNGVGGKVEPSDWCLEAAMAREFKEETNIDTTLVQWQQFGAHLKFGKFDMDPDSYTMSLFTTDLSESQVLQMSQTTPEQPMWFPTMLTTDLSDKRTGVPGAAMYIHMALNHFGRPFMTTTIET